MWHLELKKKKRKKEHLSEGDLFFLSLDPRSMISVVVESGTERSCVCLLVKKE